MAQILNNVIVWMVPYCAHKLLGLKKKAGPFTLERHIYVKALKMQGFPNN